MSDDIFKIDDLNLGRSVSPTKKKKDLDSSLGFSKRSPLSKRSGRNEQNEQNEQNERIAEDADNLSDELDEDENESMALESYQQSSLGDLDESFTKKEALSGSLSVSSSYRNHATDMNDKSFQSFDSLQPEDPHNSNGRTLGEAASVSPPDTVFATNRRQRKTSEAVRTMRRPKEMLSMFMGITKNRSGSVLQRQMILKSDHFTNAMEHNIEFFIQGAPNFRMVDMNIYGVAQPTTVGIASILTLLDSHPRSVQPVKTRVIWFSAREEPMIFLNGKPFVLRDGDQPLKNLRMFQGISGQRLERVEARLKDDILKESVRYNGLLLVHDELEQNKVIPSWISVDDVQTPREVFETFHKKGYLVEYVRVPISNEQAPNEHYLDEYVYHVTRAKPEDALVFNCGMGVGRTTFALCVALLLRKSVSLQAANLSLGTIGDRILDNRAMLRLVYVLEKGLRSKMSPRSAIEWALERGQLIDDLKNAMLGNFNIILKLTSVLQQGNTVKKHLDQVIDQCECLINIREVILMHRVRYSNTGDVLSLEKAYGWLERYFFLLAFASYASDISQRANGQLAPKIKFSEWFQKRPEIVRMLAYIRRKGPHKLYIFRPVQDLSVLIGSESHSCGVDGSGNGLALSSSLAPPPNEFEKMVIKSRHGTVLGPQTILKVDQWATEVLEKVVIMGAPNFRKIKGMPIYAVAQPSFQGAKLVLKAIHAFSSNADLRMEDLVKSLHQEELSLLDASDSNLGVDICWINLREEPLIYINSIPYVLRDQHLTLRNLKSYSGIPGPRLELIESRLQEDVFVELQDYDDRILLHGETVDGHIVPTWEDVRPENVKTLRQTMDALNPSGKFALQYHRIPITAETVPDLADFDHLFRLVCSLNLEKCSLVLNCQIGRGRSTVGTVIASLVAHWLRGQSPGIEDSNSSERLNYSIINSLIRVIRDGLRCKRIVDRVIDDCGQFLNIRDEISNCLSIAESSKVRDNDDPTARNADNRYDDRNSKRHIRRGLVHLKRYFMLILFQSFLEQLPVELPTASYGTFSSWVKQHGEFKTLLDELDSSGLEALLPVQKLLPGDGVALTSEVLDVVNNRCGAVLGAQTILKHDMFPGCQKLTLPERINGAPNFRIVSLTMSFFGTPTTSTGPSPAPVVCGCAMPAIDGIRTLLKRLKSGPSGSHTVCWTNLREEPVIYVNGKPYVLRLFQDAVHNLEATGITRERVELMEETMKRDVIEEIRRCGGRLLLHDEELSPTGSGFRIVPIWETVKECDVLTTKEIYDAVFADGYRLQYLRIPITDEQAPIPAVFDELLLRILNVLNAGNTDLIFNCQMGRGRTTTGMVITCLVQMVVGHSEWLMEHSTVDKLESGMFSTNSDSARLSPSPITTVGGKGEPPVILNINPLEESDDTKARFLQGEFKLILQLIGVLGYGKLAKALTDKAIDSCEHLQNLRSAIYDYKLRVEAAPPESRKYEALMQVGLNYLIRYFYLITFCDYLLEEIVFQVSNPSSATSSEAQLGFNGKLCSNKAISRGLECMPFAKWLSERREILNLLRKPYQTFD